VRFEHHRRLTVAAAVVVAAAALTACGSGGSSSAKSGASTTETTVKPDGTGTAKIVSYGVQDAAACPDGKTFVTIPVTFDVSGAARVELMVDGRPLKLDGTKGSKQVDVHCDPLPHTMVLVAYDAKDNTTFERKLLNTTGNFGA